MTSKESERSGTAAAAAHRIQPSLSSRTQRGSVIAGCVAIAVSIAALGLPANLNALFASELHVDGANLTWIGDADFVAAAVAAYLLGSLADRIGRKRILLFSALLLVIGQLVSGFGKSTQVLWVGQSLAGVGIGGLSVVSLAVVLAAVRKPADRPRNLAAFAASLTLGSVIASLLGAFLANGLTYRAAFLGMAAVALVGLLIIAALCAETRAEFPRDFDIAGQITLAVALFALLWAVIEGSATSWGRTAVIVAFVIGGVGVLAFLWIERRPGGMIDLTVFRNPSFAASGVTAFASFFAFTGGVYVFAIRSSIAQGQTARFVAMGLVVIGLVAGLAGFASRWLLARRAGARPLVVLGLLCFAGAGFWIAQVSVSSRGFASLLGFFILMGIGQGATTAGMTAGAVESVGREFESVATSTQGVLRQLGSPFGLALIGALVFSRSQSAFGSALSHLPLPASVSHLAAGINGQAGVLGILESGLGAKVPPVGQASVVALSNALGDGARVVAIICIVMAVIAGATMRASRESGSTVDEAAVAQKARA
jgi:MFS family permease